MKILNPYIGKLSFFILMCLKSHESNVNRRRKLPTHRIGTMNYEHFFFLIFISLLSSDIFF